MEPIFITWNIAMPLSALEVLWGTTTDRNVSVIRICSIWSKGASCPETRQSKLITIKYLGLKIFRTLLSFRSSLQWVSLNLTMQCNSDLSVRFRGKKWYFFLFFSPRLCNYLALRTILSNKFGSICVWKKTTYFLMVTEFQN